MKMFHLFVVRDTFRSMKWNLSSGYVHNLKYLEEKDNKKQNKQTTTTTTNKQKLGYLKSSRTVLFMKSDKAREVLGTCLLTIRDQWRLYGEAPKDPANETSS